LQPEIIENILSSEEVSYLKNVRDKYFHGAKKSSMIYGRLVAPITNIDDLPESVKNKVTSIASEKTNKNMKIYGVAFGRYSKDFGSPKLPQHVDEVPSQFTLDYQLDGNVDWPVNIEGVNYHSNNNSCLIFQGDSVLHWRPKRDFVDGEFLDLMWFQFIDDEHWGNSYDINPDYLVWKKGMTEKKAVWGKEYNA
jgi:hypothetical protein